jgi:hypothetical protein
MYVCAHNIAEIEFNGVTYTGLLRPCLPGGDSIQCFVERDKGGMGTMNPTYRCYQEGGENGKFLMAARKKAGSKTSYYLISLEKDAEDRGSDAVLGKIRGNAVSPCQHVSADAEVAKYACCYQIGSKYIIVDHGLAPEKTAAPSMLRKEHGIIQFEFDSGGPSKIAAFVPAVSSSGVPMVWQPTVDDESIEFAVEVLIWCFRRLHSVTARVLDLTEWPDGQSFRFAEQEAQMGPGTRWSCIKLPGSGHRKLCEKLPAVCDRPSLRLVVVPC